MGGGGMVGGERGLGEKGRRVGPWLLVGAAAIWLTAPLWGTAHAVWGLPAGDLAQTGWFYDWVARQMGGTMEYLQGFNHPQPLRRIDEFPNVLDAVLASPWAFLLDYPQQYGAAQSQAVLINGLGVAWLAWALGCRGVGLVVAGVLGVCCQQVWRELYMARLNAALPGLAAAALAAWLGVLEGGLSHGRASLRAVVATALGAAAALTYPPTLALLVPAGVVLGMGRAKSARLRGVFWGMAALAAAWILVGGELEAIRRSPRASDGMAGREIVCSLGLGCAQLAERIRLEVGFLHLQDFFRLSDPATGNWLRSGLLMGAWVPALALLGSAKTRWVGGALLFWAGVLALLSLGPCPQGTETQELPMGIPGMSGRAWCALGALHDFGRLTTVASILFAALVGWACESVFGASGRKWLPWVVGGLALAGPVQAARSHLQVPGRWLAVPEISTTAFLRAAELGAVVELPFDRRVQYLSARQVPERPRVNPLNSKPRGYSASLQIRPGDRDFPFLGWLMGLGKGEVGDPPSTEELKASKVRWVLFDPERCGGGALKKLPSGSRPINRLQGWADAPPTACADEVVRALNEVLGPPQALPGQALVWDVTALPIAR